MLSRDLLTFATMVSSLTVVVGASVDLDSGDYEVLPDNEGKSDDNGNVTFWVHDFMGKSGETVRGTRTARNDPRERVYTWVALDTNDQINENNGIVRSVAGRVSIVSIGTSIQRFRIFIDCVVPLHVVTLRLKAKVYYYTWPAQLERITRMEYHLFSIRCLFFSGGILALIKRERFVSILA